MADLLVTGGAGFVGANFVRYWRRRHPADRIVVLDALTYAGNRASLDGVDGIAFVHGDIRDAALVERLLVDHGLDTIVHLAAETHVDRSLLRPAGFVSTNVVGTQALLDAAKAAWLDRGSGRPHRFHHVSTDEVYGSLGPDDPPFHEMQRYAPTSPYAASKAASDYLVRAHACSYGLQATLSNCSNNYGPYQFPEKLIPLFVINALNGERLPLYGDGLNRRDWLHVEDHCRGIELILARGRPGETYNIGGGAELPNVAIVERICAGIDEAFARDRTLAARFPAAPAAQGRATAELRAFVADRPGHDRRYAIDWRKIGSELGYAPSRSFAEGFAATLAWYLESESWWRGVLDGSYRAWIEANYARRG